MSRSICFVSLNSYPVLTGRNLGYVGGAEVHQVLIAKELIKHDFEITFITYDHSEVQRPVEQIDGLKIIRVYKREDLHRLSLLSKTWHIGKAMRKANAAIYFHEAGAGGAVSLFCRLMGKKFVSCIASDANVSRKIKGPRLLDRLGNCLDFKLAHIIITQNEFQRAMLRENFGRDSLIIKNAFPLMGSGIPEKPKPPIVLWVGRIDNIKQPELFLTLAEAIPEARFQMIGAIWDDPRLYDRVKEASGRISNLDFVGFVPFHEVDRYFEQAAILVNTSRFEGFPNTFIQAWRQHAPTVSLNADPDEVICNNQLGFHSKTFQQLIEDVRTLIENDHLRRQMGENARQYVEKEHNIATVIRRYIEVFNCLESRGERDA